MRIKLSDLKDAEGAIQNILSKPMLPRLSYRMGKIASKITSAMKDIEMMRRELIKKHGETKDARITVPEPRMKEFQDEFEKYLEKEIDLDIQVIPWECIEQGQVQLSGMDWSVLEKFVEQPPEKK